jgi:hypothetical protein
MPFLFVLEFILIIGDVKTHPGPGTYNSNIPVNIRQKYFHMQYKH